MLLMIVLQDLIEMLHLSSNQRRNVEQELDQLTKKVEMTLHDGAEQQQLLNNRINDLQQWLIDAQAERAAAEKEAADAKAATQRLQHELGVLQEQQGTSANMLRSQLQSVEEQYQSAKKQLQK